MWKLRFILIPVIFALFSGLSAGQLESSGKTIQRMKFNKGSVIISKSILQLEGKLISPDIPKNSDIRFGMLLRNCDITENTKLSGEGSVIETEVDCLASILQTQIVGKIEDKNINEINTIMLPLDSTVAVYAIKKGIWKGKLKDAETTKEISDMLENYISPDEDSILPNKAISVGETWTLKGNRLRKFVPDSINLNGSAECTFEKIINLNGREHGLIKFILQLEYTRLDENQEEQKIRESVNGNCWIDMLTGLETELSGKTTTVINGSFGTLKSAKFSGSGTITITNRLVKNY